VRERLEGKGHDRSRGLGWLAVAWLEALTVHGPGDVQGRAVRLDDELAGLTMDAYALDPLGRRMYDSVFYSAPKGTDKSGHAARLALLEALGPCRFGGWAEGGEQYRLLDFVYTYRPGEAMGRAVTHPFVRCMATEEGQTGNVFDAVYLNLAEGPLSEVPGLDVGLTRVVLPDRGRIVPSTASAAGKDGGRESFVTFDETHLYTSNELRRMYATVRRNLAKRKAAEPWALEITTMYAPDEGSVAEDTYRTVQAVREGRARARLFADHRQADPRGLDRPLRETSERRLRQAISESYGSAAEWMDVDAIVSQLRDPRTLESDGRRYFLNMPYRSTSSWLRHGAWEKCERPGPPPPDDSRVVLALDGSFSNDSTAVIGCTAPEDEDEVPHLWVVGLWERPPNDPHWRVSQSEVEEAIIEAARRWDVVELAADPFRWQRTLEAINETGIEVVEFPQTPARMTPALASWNEAILERKVTHDGHPGLTRHVYNAVLREDSRGRRLMKDSPNSVRKIDAAVAALMAFARASYYSGSSMTPTVAFV